MRRILFLIVISIYFEFSNGQNMGIGINALNPDPSALLDLTANDKGFLITRLTASQRDAIQNPAEALMIFNTTTKCLEIFVYGWHTLWCQEDEGFICGHIISDICGNLYNTIQIGNQCWMKENLKTTKYNDNQNITNITNNSSWVSTSNGAYSWYNNDSLTYGAVYGAIYNWHAVNTNKLCPIGWHVPNNIEWLDLADYLGGVSVAGGKLKQTGTIFWITPNTGATNSSGFTALPGGGRRYDTGAFYIINEHAVFWSSNAVNIVNAWGWNLNYNNAQLTSTQLAYKINGRSVRCLKDL